MVKFAGIPPLKLEGAQQFRRVLSDVCQAAYWFATRGPGKVVMRPEDFQPDDLFAQIQGLVDRLAAECRAREAAEAANKAKADLMAMIGHELRAPMEAVVSMAERLLGTPLDPAQVHYAETLYQSARSLLGVLGDVLDFSRLEAGRCDLERSSFDLHDLIQDVGAFLQARANEKGLTGSIDIGANCPRFIVGDAARLRQVLMSLIDNALEFTSIGTVRVYASASDIDGQLFLRFDVTDTGVGLSKAVQERLFQPYVEIDSKVVGKSSATGLGLSIARKLALLMGGEIGCESVVGQGTLYWFTVPAERDRVTQPASPRPSKKAIPPGTLSGHVLVVEDNAVNRMLIVTYLDEFGLTHDVVASGTAALLSVATKPYDLVLMDTAISDLDGIETTRRIRNLQAPSSHVPIVALVAHGMNSAGGTFLAAGMDAYVMKPIRGRELYAALAPFLAGAREEPALRLVKF
jgi:signal transduction histidine kinase/CheY-like chemotaxis protein